MRVCTVVSQKEPKEAKTEERIKETKAEEPKPEVQSVLLDKAVIKSKPATYAESCGAKNIAAPKHSSVKATSLPALYSLQHISTQLRYSANAAQCRAVHTKEHR